MHRSTLLCAALLAAPGAAQFHWTLIDDLPPRRGAALHFDPALGRTLLFGGRGGGNAVLQDQWIWDGTRWATLPAPAVPPARAEAGCAWDPQRQRLVLFGGNAATGNLADTWEWDGATWSLVHPGGATAPPTRGNPLLAHDPVRGRTVLFENTQTWEWDGVTWRQRNPTNTPPSLFGAAMAWHGPSARVVLFGGLGAGGLSNATWTFDGNDWRRETPTVSPPPRSWAGMTFDPARGRTVLTGGRSHTNAQTPPYADAWQWDGSTWQPLTAVQPPPAREGALLTHDPVLGRLLLYGGGRNPTQAEGDLWQHDGTTWVQAHPGPVLPPGGLVRAAYDPARGRTVLFASDGSTWEHDGNRWRMVAQGGGPGPRNGYGLCHDTARGRTVLFGGGNLFGPPLGDTWEWDGTAWTQRQPAVSPPPRAYPALAYDAARQRTVLFGGVGRSDTWEWDGSTWVPIATPVAPTGGFRALAYDARRRVVVLFAGDNAGETWEYDGGAWRLRASGGQPGLRGGYALAYDALRDRTVMVGGTVNGSPVDEAWEWDGATWRQHTGAVPDPRHDAALVFDSARRELLLYGGSFLLAQLRQTWRGATDHPAAFMPFGSGCAASAGVPVLAAVGGTLPWQGDPFALELGGLAAGALGALCFGIGTTTWGGQPLPAALAPGMPGCTLYLDIASVTDLRPAGAARWDFRVPLDARLVGLRLHCQGLVLDAAVTNLLRAAVSNAATGIVGLR